MYVDKHGQPYPVEAFENEAQARPVPLTAEQRAKFDAETEALRKHAKK